MNIRGWFRRWLGEPVGPIKGGSVWLEGPPPDVPLTGRANEPIEPPIALSPERKT